MNNNVKIGLMTVIAVGLIAGGYFLGGKGDTAAQKAEVVASATPANVSSEDVPGANTLDGNGTESLQRNDPKTIMTFAQQDHDFGKINQDTENTKVFKFTNSGTKPLIIYDAKGSCGCTVPEYPKEPIAPGEEGEIKVVYKPGKQKDIQTKYVTLTSNTEPEQTKLKITAEVQVLASGE
jgi:hypothetical protein